MRTAVEIHFLQCAKVTMTNSIDRKTFSWASLKSISNLFQVSFLSVYVSIAVRYFYAAMKTGQYYEIE